MESISFIGLGHMGNPMAANLVKAGFKVFVFDINKAAEAELVKLGATAVSSIKDAALQADIVITMLQTDDQVKGICLGEDGLLQNLNKDSLYIDSSSIDISVTKELHEEAKSANIAMLDAPVSGGVKGAINKTLTFMVGGELSAFERAKPILEAMGGNIIHAGDAGHGQAAKICNNLILAISMIAVSEGFTLADKLGLDPKKFFEIASVSTSQCWSMTKYCPYPGIIDNVPANNEYKPGFTAKMMLKDLLLSQKAQEIVNTKLPMASRALDIYATFVSQGNEEIDFSGIIKMIETNGEYA